LPRVSRTFRYCGFGNLSTGSFEEHLQPSRLHLRSGAQHLRSPSGAELTSTGNVDQGHIVYYRANKNDCSICALKPKCTIAVVRKVTRDIDEDVRDRVPAQANTEAFQQSCRQRRKIEMRFCALKRILRLDRLRLRGLSGARDEVLHTATAQNLRRLVKLLGRPPPLAARLSSVGVESGSGTDASTPQLPQRHGTAKSTTNPGRKRKQVLQHNRGSKRTLTNCGRPRFMSTRPGSTPNRFVD
jgi:hypothetical protein